MTMRIYAFFADALTTVRLLISPTLVYLGWHNGASVLPQVVLLVLVGVVADGLDGPLARLAQRHTRTRLGRYDFAVDVLFTWAIFVYLTLAGFIPWPLALVYTLLAVLVVAHFQRKSVIIVFMRPIDVTGGIIALRHTPEMALLLFAWLVGLGIVHWRRVKERTWAWLCDLYATVRGKASRGGER